MKKNVKIVNAPRSQIDKDGKLKYENGNNGDTDYVLPVLNNSQLGGARAPRKTAEDTILVKSDDNGYLYVRNNDTVYTLPEATENSLGGVKAGIKTTETLEAAIGLDGKLYVEDLTKDLDIPDEYVLPAAKSSALGGVKAEVKTTETLEAAIGSDGKLYVEDLTKDLNIPDEYVLPAAESNVLGGVKAEVKTTETLEAAIGSDGKLYVEDLTKDLDIPEEYVLPAASLENLGGVKAENIEFDDTIPVRINEEGKLFVKDMTNVNYVLPKASEGVLGGVYAVSNTNDLSYVSIDNEGFLRYTKSDGASPDYVLPVTTIDTLGGVKAAESNSEGNSIYHLDGKLKHLKSDYPVQKVNGKTGEVVIESSDIDGLDEKINLILNEFDLDQEQIDLINEELSAINFRYLGEISDEESIPDDAKIGDMYSKKFVGYSVIFIKGESTIHKIGDLGEYYTKAQSNFITDALNTRINTTFSNIESINAEVNTLKTDSAEAKADIENIINFNASVSADITNLQDTDVQLGLRIDTLEENSGSGGAGLNVDKFVSNNYLYYESSTVTSNNLSKTLFLPNQSSWQNAKENKNTIDYYMSGKNTIINNRAKAFRLKFIAGFNDASLSLTNAGYIRLRKDYTQSEASIDLSLISSYINSSMTRNLLSLNTYYKQFDYKVIDTGLVITQDDSLNGTDLPLTFLSLLYGDGKVPVGIDCSNFEIEFYY